jgi:carboxymethylenebutenolidase
VGETVEFKSNGSTALGYLAMPSSGSGPGVIVIQEWWGLNDQIRRTADRFASEGFVALAPDLYHGELAGHDEMDKAGHLMSTMPPDRAARDMSGAVDYLVSRSETTGQGVGVVGFCMGGMLAFSLAALRPDKVHAAVPFYGFPQGDDEPEWSGCAASIWGHMSNPDDYFTPEAAKALEAKLQGMGKDVTIDIHNAGHAFMNEENPMGTYDERLAIELWPKVVGFLHEKLG